jgi:hypothetical protein
MKTIFIDSLILIMSLCLSSFAFILASSCSYLFAQSSSTTEDKKQIVTTSGGTLDVKLEPSPNPIKSGEETKFRVSFFKKGTETVQPHIDYDFIILKNKEEVFSAAKQTGQPLLHTAEGIVTIPFTIEESGSYTIRVAVMGINFIPIATEYTEFPIKV